MATGINILGVSIRVHKNFLSIVTFCISKYMMFNSGFISQLKSDLYVS